MPMTSANSRAKCPNLTPRMRMVTTAIFFACMTPGAVGVEPEGPSQQCRDDAGPPWADDTGNYFDGSPATPQGECPAPLAAACDAKGKKSAFLAGPVDCGGRGWFCRISPQQDYVPEGGFRDANFAHCNRTDADDSDTDGHCHGSDQDSVYGWWVRDHWFRGYAGHLTCCCDWNRLKGLTNRCDYRRPVAQGEDLNACRDANEGHSLGFEDGCSAHKQVPFEDPATRSDGQCWTVSSFADPSAVMDASKAEGKDMNASGGMRGKVGRTARSGGSIARGIGAYPVLLLAAGVMKLLPSSSF